MSSIRVGDLRSACVALGFSLLATAALAQVFPLPKGVKLSGIFDAFNLFNSNAEQNLSWSSGSSFLRPLNIIPPRIVRIGARVTF
jgi:hypothetical protein